MSIVNFSGTIWLVAHSSYPQTMPLFHTSFNDSKLHDYLKNYTYPNVSTREITQQIRNNSRRYYAKGQRLFLKSDSPTAIEVLHSANIRDSIIHRHEEGHFRVTNSYIRSKLQFHAEHLYGARRDTVNSCDCVRDGQDPHTDEQCLPSW